MDWWSDAYTDAHTDAYTDAHTDAHTDAYTDAWCDQKLVSIFPIKTSRTILEPNGYGRRH